MFKKSCNKCKRLNIINMNITITGKGKTNTKCQFCVNKIVFEGKNKINIKVIEKEIIPKEEVKHE